MHYSSAQKLLLTPHPWKQLTPFPDHIAALETFPSRIGPVVDRARSTSLSPPLQQSTITDAAVEVGVAARRRQQAKDEAAYSECEAAGIEFLPVAVETFGTWGPVAVATIGSIGRRWADRHCESPARAIKWVFQKLSVALQRGNAAMFLARGPTPHDLFSFE